MKKPSRSVLVTAVVVLVALGAVWMVRSRSKSELFEDPFDDADSFTKVTTPDDEPEVVESQQSASSSHGSLGSFCSIGSIGSSFSIGSVASFCSIGSIGSAFSIGSVASCCSIGSLASLGGFFSGGPMSNKTSARGHRRRGSSGHRPTRNHR